MQYQLWYRMRKYLPQAQATPVVSQPRRLKFSSYDLVRSEKKYTGANRFCFLNREHQFESGIDWNFIGYGKLWNYNLQYFDCLLDQTIPSVEKEFLLEDFSKHIIERNVSLEPYPVSVRLVNWLLYHSVSGYRSETFNRALAVQVHFLGNNLEYHIGANHLLENFMALFVAGLYVDPNQAETVSGKLIQALDEQFLSDGSHYEGSPMYHRVLLSRLLICYGLLYENHLHDRVCKKLKKTVEKALGWLEWIQYPDGSTPLFNDAAPGIAPSATAIFESAARYGLQPQRDDVGTSGYRKMKLPFGIAFIDAAPIVPAFQPGHAHADYLHFTLWAEGKEWIFDPGISTYEKNAQRQLERSTLFHNTVTVGDANQSDVWGGFRVGRRASLTLHHDREDLVSASHDGFLKSHGYTHRRTFKAGSNLVVDDVLSGRGKAAGKARFFINARDCACYENSCIADGSLQLSFQHALKVETLPVKVPDGYNKFKNAWLVEVAFVNKLKTEISWIEKDSLPDILL